MKRMISLTVVSLIVVGLILSGCIGGEETPPPPSQQEEEEGEVIELKFATTVPSVGDSAQLYTRWGEKVTEITDGRVKFVFYYGSSLFTAPEIVESVKAGVADVSDMYIDVFPGVFNLNSYSWLTFLPVPSDPVRGSGLWWELYHRYPEIQEEWEGMTVLYNYIGTLEEYFFDTDNLITSVEDLKGKKIMFYGGILGDWYSALGAVPVQVAFGDSYTTMDSGLTEATMTSFRIAKSSGIIDIVPYRTLISTPMRAETGPIVMYPASWNKLPPDIQKLMADLQIWYCNERMKPNLILAEQYLSQTPADHYAEFSAADIQKMKDAASTLTEEWIEEREAKGLPARALYEDIIAIGEAYNLTSMK